MMMMMMMMTGDWRRQSRAGVASNRIGDYWVSWAHRESDQTDSHANQPPAPPIHIPPPTIDHIRRHSTL